MGVSHDIYFIHLTPMLPSRTIRVKYRHTEQQKDCEITVILFWNSDIFDVYFVRVWKY